MASWQLLSIYCLIIIGASLVGGWIPLVVKFSHRQMEIAVSFVAGVLLGVSLLHMLPHALEGASSPGATVRWVLVGLLSVFFLERFFCFHHHNPPGEEEGSVCGHDHQHGHVLTWSSATIGLTVHSIIAGVALAASVEAEAEHAHAVAFSGLGTFLAIVLHKPFDSLTIGTLMSAKGAPRRTTILVNGLFSLAVPLGVLLFFWSYGQTAHDGVFLSNALAVSCGMFLCIALSDLLPELQFHRHDLVQLSVALLLGIAVAWAIEEIEDHGEHDHGTWHTPSHGVGSFES